MPSEASILRVPSYGRSVYRVRRKMVGRMDDGKWNTCGRRNAKTREEMVWNHNCRWIGYDKIGRGVEDETRSMSTERTWEKCPLLLLDICHSSLRPWIPSIVFTAVRVYYRKAAGRQQRGKHTKNQQQNRIFRIVFKTAHGCMDHPQ